VGLTAIPDSIVLDVGLVARSCHKSMLIKYINLKEKNKEKKPKERKKLMKKKKKNLN
jgi:hypothetical protein